MSPWWCLLPIILVTLLALFASMRSGQLSTGERARGECDD